jgi:hypothetical protein
MIARSVANQIKYYVLAVSEWFSHGLHPLLKFTGSYATSPFSEALVRGSRALAPSASVRPIPDALDGRCRTVR